MAGRRRGWVYTLVLIAGLLIGSLIGKLCVGNPYLWWLGYGIDFGLSLPQNVTIDIYIVRLSFAFSSWFHFNVASMLGMFTAWLIYRKW
ncbi:MAG: DUF4321 domain-containing protein [Clostridia bacterium]|nr:DUF4321 domain-containing protein [Clostridia bacterium]MBQ3553922.1 DUF4321 domain-containing protein [Clostridia bacterium]